MLSQAGGPFEPGHAAAFSGRPETGYGPGPPGAGPPAPRPQVVAPGCEHPDARRESREDRDCRGWTCLGNRAMFTQIIGEYRRYSDERAKEIAKLTAVP